MGAVTFSIDSRLIETLKQKLPFDVFVETGTFRGETIDLIKEHFNHIYSVELSQTYYQEARAKFDNDPKVTLIHGDSAKAITSIVQQTRDRPTLFWLDAHWCVASNTAGDSSQCPLLAELDAINPLNNESMIIIDDARLFLAAPPAPHEISHWPTLDAITRRLYKLSSSHQLVVVNDCILFYPDSIEPTIQAFAYQHGIDWLSVMDKSRDYNKLLDQLIDKEKLIMRLATQLESLHRIPGINLFKKLFLR